MTVMSRLAGPMPLRSMMRQHCWLGLDALSHSDTWRGRDEVSEFTALAYFWNCSDAPHFN